MSDHDTSPAPRTLGTSWSKGFGLDRLAALSDGVFAIAMTLLVLDIHVPNLRSGLSDAQVAHDLRLSLRHALAPGLSYVISFVVLGVYWNAQRNLLHTVQHANHTFVWMHIALLLAIAFVPFPAGLLGRYPGQRDAVVLYGLSLLLVGLLLLALWIYGVRGNRLTDGKAVPEFVRLGIVIFALPPLLYGSAALLAFWTVRASLVVYALVPGLYIFRGWIDRFIIHLPAAGENDL